MHFLTLADPQHRAGTDETDACQNALHRPPCGVGVYIWQATMHDRLHGDAARQTDQTQRSQAHDLPVLARAFPAEHHPGRGRHHQPPDRIDPEADVRCR